MLQCATESDLIFYKQVGAAGFIFVLKFERFQKKHSYMEAKIAELDLNLKSLSKCHITNFVSIGENDNTSKVRSFGRGGRLKAWASSRWGETGPAPVKKRTSTCPSESLPAPAGLPQGVQIVVQ